MGLVDLTLLGLRSTWLEMGPVPNRLGLGPTRLYMGLGQLDSIWARAKSALYWLERLGSMGPDNSALHGPGSTQLDLVPGRLKSIWASTGCA